MGSSTLKSFEYFEPATIREASTLLHEHGGGAKPMAGGVDLIPRMRTGDVKVTHLINLQRIIAADYVRFDPAEGLAFGALASLRSLETSAALQAAYPALHEAVHQITSMQTKFMGTAVGNICVATPASDIVPALAALDACLVVVGPGGERSIPVTDFYPGYHQTALLPGELVAGVKVPANPERFGTAFMNLVRTHADVAKVTVTAGLGLLDGVCREARIAVGAVAPTMFRAHSAEAVLAGRELSHDLIARAAQTAAQEATPITDLRSTAEYRREMVRVLVGRVLEKAAERAQTSPAKEGAR
jgi:aerobic carbon-monoxide dehydrogenase medium subunit